MSDTKCNYCKNIGENFCCLACDYSDFPYNRLNIQNSINLMEDFPICEVSYYRGCKIYLEKLASLKLDKSNTNLKVVNESLEKFKWGDEFS